MQLYDFNISGQVPGLHAPSASVQVNNYPSGTAATLYASNDTNGLKLTNPIIASVDGSYQFWAAAATYSFVITPVGGVAQTVPQSATVTYNSSGQATGVQSGGTTLGLPLYTYDANGNVIALANPANTGNIPLGGGYENVGQSSLGTRLSDFNTLTGFTINGTGTMVLVNANIPSIGKNGNSIKVTIPAGTTATLTIPAWTAVQNPTSKFSLCFENLTLDLTGYATWYMGVGGYGNHYYNSPTFDRYGLQLFDTANDGTTNTWVVGAGAPTFPTVNVSKLTFGAPAAEDLVLILHGMWASSFSPPIIQIVNDDSLSSVYPMWLPMLNQYGFKAGFSTIASAVIASTGLPGSSLSYSQLAQLYREGHDVIPHGDNALSSYGSAALAIADIQTNASFLTNLGYTRGSNVYTYPNGACYYSATDKTSIINYLIGAGYKAAFLASRVTNAFPYAGINAMRTPRYGLNATVNTTTLLANIDLAIAAGQGLTIMCHQMVPSGATVDQCNFADVVTVFDGIRARVLAGKCVVLPPSKALLAQLY